MLYELSVKLSETLPRYDETIPKCVFQPYTTIKNGDYNNQTVISVFSHSGSHVDAPYHFCLQGKSIEEVDIADFIFTRALFINVETGKGGRIPVERLRGTPGLEQADILLLYTGYSRYCDNEPVFRDDFPALTLETCRFLREELPELKAIALDTMSVDGTDGYETGFANHHMLLEMREDNMRPILIYENMNFTPIIGCRDFFKVYGIPLRMKGLDASPVTMVAEL